ncbi:MAG: EAL domain-containing protein [Lachnospiraceae bacterium]|nr:EAL domain-containing protein [Lachnospiraceae bacterium]
MGQQLYFDNYNAAADIVVLAVCIVVSILIATSFMTRTKTFRLFLTMLIYLFFAALSDMVMHDYYTYITDGNYTVIYVIRIIYHFLLLSLFLLYIVYLVAILDLDKKNGRPIMIASTSVYSLAVIADIVLTVKGLSFRLNSDGSAVSGLNILLPGYIAFILIIGFVLIRHKDRLYSKTIMGMIGTIAVSILILLNQGRHGQTSLTVATFLFPTLGLLYLFHSNPYNIGTGTISASALRDAINYNYVHKRDFYYVSLLLPDFASEGKAIPKDLQGAIRQFPARHFRKSALFQISNGYLFMMVPEKNNPDSEDKVREDVRAFLKEYRKFHYNYKLVIGKSVDVISKRNEYLNFLAGIMRKMRINSVHLVDSSDINDFNASEAVLAELEDIHAKHDLDDPRVLAYCQPVFNIKTGKYDTAEALMRLNFPGLGMVYPDLFIPLAEEFGYIHMLTEIILRKTCIAIKSMIGEGYEVSRISVNVSMHELRDADFTKDIEDIISSSGVPDGKIAIEITESQTDSDFLIVKSMMEELKGIGINFYLDDFGTGYSNMDRIMKLPFDIIKFDKSLVLATENDRRSEEIVGRLAGMFADLNYSVLYEGVENDNDEERCINMSASYLQGYIYSRPVPIEELKKFFSKV